MNLDLQRGVYGFSMPLWILMIVCCAVAVVAFRADILARRHARIGKCIACGYALEGLPTDAPCPECGRNPKAQSAAAPHTEDGAQDPQSPPN